MTDDQTAPQREHDAARPTFNDLCWADFRQSLATEEQVLYLLQIAKDPVVRLLLSPTAEGSEVLDWLLQDILPGLVDVFDATECPAVELLASAVGARPAWTLAPLN